MIVKYPNSIEAGHSSSCCHYLGQVDRLQKNDTSLFKCDSYSSQVLFIVDNVVQYKDIADVNDYAKEAATTNFPIFWTQIKKLLDAYAGLTPPTNFKFPKDLTFDGYNKVPQAHNTTCCTLVSVVPGASGGPPVNVFLCTLDCDGLYYSNYSPNCTSVWFIDENTLNSPNDNKVVHQLQKVWGEIKGIPNMFPEKAPLIDIKGCKVEFPKDLIPAAGLHSFDHTAVCCSYLGSCINGYNIFECSNNSTLLFYSIDNIYVWNDKIDFFKTSNEKLAQEMYGLYTFYLKQTGNESPPKNTSLDASAYTFPFKCAQGDLDQIHNGSCCQFLGFAHNKNYNAAIYRCFLNKNKVFYTIGKIVYYRDTWWVKNQAKKEGDNQKFWYECASLWEIDLGQKAVLNKPILFGGTFNIVNENEAKLAKKAKAEFKKATLKYDSPGLVQAMENFAKSYDPEPKLINVDEYRKNTMKRIIKL